MEGKPLVADVVRRDAHRRARRTARRGEAAATRLARVGVRQLGCGERTWTGADGRQVTKTYQFEAGRYVIGLDYQVSNPADQPWSISAYGQVWRTPADAGGGTPFSQDAGCVGASCIRTSLWVRWRERI